MDGKYICWNCMGPTVQLASVLVIYNMYIQKINRPKQQTACTINRKIYKIIIWLISLSSWKEIKMKTHWCLIRWDENWVWWHVWREKEKGDKKFKKGSRVDESLKNPPWGVFGTIPNSQLNIFLLLLLHFFRWPIFTISRVHIWFLFSHSLQLKHICQIFYLSKYVPLLYISISLVSKINN